MTEGPESPASQSHGTEQREKQPAGGHDPTPVPTAPPGYTVRITFHRAHNLPFADFHTLSSDPYLTATLKSNLPRRHKEDPDLVFRTPTIRRNTNPEWNSVWNIAHVPSSGFDLKIRLYDEDRADHDDRLGVVHVNANGICRGWSGIKEERYSIKKRMASKRAYFVRGCAAMLWREAKMDGQLDLSVECLGESEGSGGRAYTIGPCYWTRHYSPLIGRLAGTKARDEDQEGQRQTERYNFQAIQMQLAGPVPPELYHRYVEFKPFVAGMFNARSPRGWILNRTLHHQHSRIYNYDSSTLYGHFQEPYIDMTKQFLDFVHYDDGGRIFTYVLTLDARWRFTETGKEFGIDLLSKHTMHSNASIYIAFSGEFLIRRLNQPGHRKPRGGGSENESNPESHTGDNSSDSRSNTLLSETANSAEPSASGSHSTTNLGDPSNYEMIIDNDSGTYRPNAECLPAFRHYMRRSLPGLRVVTLDCQADAERLAKLKEEQRRRKRETKGQVQYLQRKSTSSSVSSSDEEELDEMGRLNIGEADKRKGEGKLKQRVHDGVATVKPGVEMTTQGVKDRLVNGGHEGHGESGKCGRGSRGMGGIVGEDGPVRMREKAQRLEKQQDSRMRHSRQKSSREHPNGDQSPSAEKQGADGESGAHRDDEAPNELLDEKKPTDT